MKLSHLLPAKNGAGEWRKPYWFAVIFGGIYVRGKAGACGYQPGIIKSTRRYYKQNWKEAGYTWFQFVFNKPTKLVKTTKPTYNKESNLAFGPKDRPVTQNLRKN